MRIVQGVSDGLALMEMQGIDEVLERMRERAQEYDRYTAADGSWRGRQLKKPRDIKEINLFLEESFTNHILSMKDPVTEMKRTEQTMTVYRGDGSCVEIRYRHGKVKLAYSGKRGETRVMPGL